MSTSILKNLNVAKEAAGEEDRLGGFQVFDSKVYAAKIKMAYLRQAAAPSKSMGLTLIFDLEGKEYTQTIYITNKTTGDTFTIDADGKKKNMQGYNLANALAMVACGKPLNQLDDEERLQKIRNYKEKKDENIKVQVIVDLLEKEVNVGIIKQEVNKQTKVGDSYVDTADTREENEISKFFCAKKKFLNMTASEMVAAKDDDTVTAEFFIKWNTQNEGKVINRVKAVAGGGKSGAPKTGGVAKPEVAEDLFGDDD